MPNQTETIYTCNTTPYCDGSGEGLASSLGHPRVFLAIQGNYAVCPYCNRHFILKTESVEIEAS